MPSFFSKQLRPFYKTVNENLGNITLLGGEGTISRQNDDVSKRIYSSFIERAISGEKFIPTLLSLPNFNLNGSTYNCIYQKDGTTSSTDDPDVRYWYASPPAATAASDIKEESKISDYWTQVCEQPGNPPVPFMINVLKSPLLSPNRKNVGEIEFFLNYMPSIFVSQMVPYFNVEFQLPVPDGDSAYFLNRPSLLRFLLGSVNYAAMNLTEADKSLISVFGKKTDPPTTASPDPSVGGGAAAPTAAAGGVSAGPSPADPQFVKEAPQPPSPVDSNDGLSYFTGMEMFTTPMTLTNMDSLTTKESSGSPLRRVKDANPFMPPASLIGGSVKVINAGAGTFLHHSADIEIKIHDKARVTEFSEFIRGPSGYKDTTVWLTYGWLSPRGRGPYDAYAKFINENMLTRMAFSVKNVGFTFQPGGQVSMKIELVSKGHTDLQTIPIGDFAGDELKKAKKELMLASAYVSRNKGVFSSYGGQDTRIQQILNSASEGIFTLNMEEQELTKTISDIETGLKNAKPKPRNFVMMDKVIQALKYIYIRRNDANLHGASNSGMGEWMNKIASQSSVDPFLPVLAKNNEDKQKYIFSTSLVKEMSEATKSTVAADKTGNAGAATPPKPPAPVAPPPASPTPPAPPAKPAPAPAQKKPALPQSASGRRVYTTFGKIFSVFCMPLILSNAKANAIDEVQFNFYQLNESCGPVSLHSIAEFPIDVGMFIDQFADFVAKRGGDQMTLEEFMEFVCKAQFSDPRAPGYGMSSFYEPYKGMASLEPQKRSETKKGDKAFTFGSAMAKWSATYGNYKPPIVTMKIETLPEGEASGSNVDLLQEIQGSVGVSGNKKIVAPAGKKLIKKIHIYDKTADPFSGISENFFYDKDKNSYYVADAIRGKTKVTTDQANKFYTNNSSKLKAEINIDTVKIGPNKIISGKKYIGGSDILRDFVSEIMPVITIGTNGTLIKECSLASKMDGLLGTINALGGSFRATNSLTNNGLGMSQNLPMRVIPAQMTMTSLGCPIADLYQQYYIDYGTGTTLDNTYTVTQLVHNFSPGKYDTQWTFAYTDGYARFFGAPSMENFLQTLKDDLKVSINTQAAPEVKNPAKNAPPPEPATTDAFNNFLNSSISR